MKKYNLNQKKKFMFYGLSLILTSVFFLSVFITYGDSLLNILHTNDGDTFMDFFVLFGADKNSFVNGGIYPPLAYIFIIFVRHFLNPFACEVESYTNVKLHQNSMLLLGIMLVFFSIFVTAICMIELKATYFEKIVFVCLMFLSAPMLYEIERANIVFLAWVFLGLFFVLRNHSNKIVREFAYLCLAISAGVKLYPAIFGLLLIFERKYKAAIRTFIYGLVAFFLPLLYFGGFSNIIRNLKILLTNFSSGVEYMVSSHFNYNISYYITYNTFFKHLGVGKLSVDTITTVLIVITAILLLISLLVIQSTKKRILILTCLLIGIPQASFCYIAIFLIFPLIYFLNDDNSSKLDLLYIFFFILILFPLPINLFSTGIDKRKLYWDTMSPFTLQQICSLFVLNVLIVVDATRTLIITKKGLLHKLVH